MPAFEQGRCLPPDYRFENYGRDTRYLDYWRVYIYVNKLHSLPGRRVRGFRKMTPTEFRTNRVALERVLMFANRDLAVLLCNKKKELMQLRQEVLLNLLFDCNIKSLEFRFALSSYLGNWTNHFVSELISYARSPYDDPFCYELNMMYKSDVPVDGAVLHSFVDFSKRIDVNEFESDMLTVNLFNGFEGYNNDFIPLSTEQNNSTLPDMHSNMQVDGEVPAGIGPAELNRMLNYGIGPRSAAGVAAETAIVAHAEAAVVAAAEAAAGAAAEAAAATTAMSAGHTPMTNAQLVQVQTAAALAARRLTQQQQRLTHITNHLRLARKLERRRMKLNKTQRQQQ